MNSIGLGKRFAAAGLVALLALLRAATGGTAQDDDGRPELRVLPLEDMTLVVDQGAIDGEVVGELIAGNAGTGALAWFARGDVDWLILSPMRGTFDGRGRQAISLRIDRTRAALLAPGRHAATISVSNETNGAGSVERRFELIVRDGRGLEVASKDGGFVLSNAGSSRMPWVARSAEPWLAVEPSEGELEPGASVEVGLARRERPDRPGRAGRTDRADPTGRTRPTDDDAEEPAHDARRIRTRGAVAFVNRLDGVGTTLRTVALTESGEVKELAGGAPQHGARSLSRFGITWTFDRAYPSGTFANGDPWVIGPVAIVGIDPESTTTNGRVTNGSMINPSPKRGMTQGYDSAMYDKYKEEGSFTPRANVALDVSAYRPLVVRTHSSLVSSISEPQAGARPQLATAAILTVLDCAPPDGAFRPPYCGDDKTIDFTVDMLDRGKLASLARVRSTPRLERVERMFERPWIDHVTGWFGRYLHPSQNMPDYGREITDDVGTGALVLHLDFPVEAKETLLIRYVQLGIDLFGVLLDGGSWPPSAGHLNGRKWPILFAGLMLGDDAMAGIGSDYGPEVFSEDGQTFFVEAPRPELGYTRDHVGLAEWGTSHATRPELDDPRWLDSEPFPEGATEVELRTQSVKYRLCCTANVFWGQLLAAYVMGAKEAWNHDALFAYQDRYHDTNVRLGVTDYRQAWTPFAFDMWERYRREY